VTSLTPHMHVRGKDMTYTAFYPDGTSEVLLRVPKYDFNWQITYDLAKPKSCRREPRSRSWRTSTTRRATSTTPTPRRT
jgi:hypothetical protein